ncbi:MAG: Eco57I restriction-modification methylase domain-containing protein [Chloroflexi bacterium]|nr:Eco57I restriction-modification methylase domain-containing protein [Chloroflexota bacterium]
MAADTVQRVYSLLGRLPTDGLQAAKQLFWTELNYDRAAQPLSDRGWPDTVRTALASPPLLLARYESTFGAFDVIFIKLADKGASWAFPLSLSAERQVIGQLLPDHPYALFVFSDPAERHWHFVNVRPDREKTTRRIQRRIAVGPNERLRTAAERMALLDIAAVPGDLFGLSPLAIQAQHDEAFNVEAVTQKFFEEYHRVFDRVEGRITGFADADRKRLFTQRLFNRLMFIAFIQKKGWLRIAGETDYLSALWQAYQRERAAQRDYTGTEPNFYRDRLRVLFFTGLNTPNEVNVVGIRSGGPVEAVIGQVPYLNGGLFEEDTDDRNPDLVVPDDCFAAILGELFDRFNFTVTESTPLDVEVAVDPEMLGSVFEELVTGRHETGSYYTHKPVVAFMCREALKGYLRAVLPTETAAAIEKFVDEHDPAGLRNPEAVLEALRAVKVVDLACGSGAYLLGMLHELLDLRACLFATRHIDPLSVYGRKLEIIQNNLYGVDIDSFAVNIARLRLWLSLAVDFEGDSPPPLPNLDFKIEVGDSLTAPDPSGGLQPDLFRQQQIEEFLRSKADYLMAHGSEKLALRDRIAAQRAQIAAWARPAAPAPPPIAGLPASRAAGEGLGRAGFDWAVEFAEVFAAGGFHIVVANPPYVRADAPFRHIANEERRQAEIQKWQAYRAALKASGIYKTLHEKWDLYIPFLERGHQLLRRDGQMAFIIPDAYNAAKYAVKSHEFFLTQSRIERLDFCSEIPLFKAGVNNTILHFAKTAPDDARMPRRFRRWGERAEDFEDNVQALSIAPQKEFGSALFRLDGRKPGVSDVSSVPLEMICYISVGMVINADERRYRGSFTTDELISEVGDSQHPKAFVQGRDVDKWSAIRVRYLEWGTERAPSMFRRLTFPEIYESPEKLIAVKVSHTPEVAYDNQQLHHTDGLYSFVPWYYLQGVVNRSIEKTTKYRWQDPTGDREDREKLSAQFRPKYLVAVMNSAYVRDWLAHRRRHKIQLYPDDWKQLPIAPISLAEQQEFVRLVDAILAEFAAHGYPLPAESATRVAAIERELDARVAALYEVVMA